MRALTLTLVFAALLIVRMCADASREQFGDLTKLYIDAIIPCQIFFSRNSSDVTSVSQYLNCTSFTPGNGRIQASWPECYFNCCPGFNVPVGSTINDISICYDQYQKRPVMVIVIGIIILLMFVTAFFIIPLINDNVCEILFDLCCNKTDEQAKKDLQKSQKSEQHLVQEGNVGEFDFLVAGLSKINKFLVQNQVFDDEPPQARICQMCEKGDSNALLCCGHSFHSKCLNQSGQGINLSSCPKCKQKDIFPTRIYCWKCLRKYFHINNGEELEGKFICNECDQ